MATINELLRYERRSRGWTLEHVAAGLQRIAAELDWDEIAPEPSTVGRWERGVRKPSLRTVQLLTRLFDMSADQLGLVNRPSAEPAGGGIIGDMDVSRRRFAALTALAPFVDWPSVLTTHVEPGLLPDLAALTRAYVTMRRTTALAVLQPPVLMHLAMLRAKLDGSLTGTLRRDLSAITAETATLAGRNAFLMGHPSEAQQHWAYAFELAGDHRLTALQAQIRLHQQGLYAGSQYRYGGVPTRAGDYAEEAVSLAGPNPHPALAAATRAIRAEQRYAVAGDFAAAMLDLDAAERAVAHAPFDAESLLNPRSSAELAAIRGSTLVLLGQPAEAVAALELAGSMLVDRVSWQGTVSADLGAAYAQLGDHDRAFDALGRALTLVEHDGARHNVDRVAGIRRAYLSSATGPAADELGARLAALAP